MMQTDLPEFVDRIFDGYAVLFLGSGFSAHAKNRHKETLPSGTSLARLLREKLELTSEYPLDVLAREYAAKFGENRLLSLLEDKLTAAEVSDDQKAVLTLPWRRIYTTNYDNVIDVATEHATRKIKAATLRDRLDHDRGATQCVYLNGRLSSVDIHSFQTDIKLTRASYLTDTFLDTPWSATFKNDLALATVVVFIGYSMYDLDIARIIYEDPILRSKTCFIDTPFLDPVLNRELSQFGEVFPVGIAGLVTEAAKISSLPKTRINFTSFSSYSVPDVASQPTSTDVNSLFIRGEIKDEKLLGARVGPAKYTIERTSLGIVLEKIESGAKRFLIHADIGNGKTVLLHLLRIALVQKGYHVITLKQNYDNVDDDIRLLAERSEKYIVIVEELFRNKDLIEKISFAAPECTLISTARTSTFDLRNNDVEEIFQEDFIEIDLNNLSSREAGELVALASENGLWGDLGSKSFDQKLTFIQTKCGNEIRSFLLHLFESPSFKEQIRATFYAGIDSEILNCIVALLFLDVANFDPDLLTVTQIAQVDLLRQARLKKDQTTREYVDFTSGKVRVKSSILSQYILKEIIDYDISLKYLIKAIRACETGRRENRLLHEVQKEFMKFSFIDKIFARTKNTNHYVQFYDGLRTLPSMSRNPQFWLQYAIARIEHSEYKSADILFRTAYSLAKSLPNYNTFQIDNHFARFLLVSRTLDSSYGDYFKAFIDAHGLLMKQARTEKDAYYPFKVARSYHDFVLQNGPRFVPEQRGAIDGAIQQMIKQIDRSSKHVLRYRLVQEARSDLARTSELLRSFG